MRFGAPVLQGNGNVYPRCLNVSKGAGTAWRRCQASADLSPIDADHFAEVGQTKITRTAHFACGRRTSSGSHNSGNFRRLIGHSSVVRTFLITAVVSTRAPQVR